MAILKEALLPVQLQRGEHFSKSFHCADLVIIMALNELKLLQPNEFKNILFNYFLQKRASIKQYNTRNSAVVLNMKKQYDELISACVSKISGHIFFATANKNVPKSQIISFYMVPNAL